MVQWVTKNSSNPTVKWGTSPGAYNHSAAAVSSTYSRQELCGPPANDAGFVDPGLFHAALVEGLTPGQRYYYVVGDEVRGKAQQTAFMAAQRPVSCCSGGGVDPWSARLLHST